MKPGSTFKLTVSDDTIPINAYLIGGTNTIDIAASLPEMSKADLMKEWLMLFNGIAYFKGGVLNVTGFDSLPLMDARDWSKKVDMESGRTVIVTSPLGKTTNFKYTNDSDTTPIWACAKVAINNQNIPDDITYHGSKFAASYDVFLMGLTCMRIPIFEGSVNDGPGTASHAGGTGNLNITFSEAQEFDIMGNYIRIIHLQRDFLILNWNASTLTATVAGPTTIPNFTNRDFEIYTIKQVKLNPRLGIVSIDNVTTSIKYRQFGTVSTITSFKRIEFANLDWVTLLKVFYRTWLGSLENYKLVRLFVLLDESDIMDFDTTHVIFIEGQGQFYCQALNKYVGEGEPTEAELLTLKAPIALTSITTL